MFEEIIDNFDFVEIDNVSTRIHWIFGNHCQYSCSYCPSSLHEGSSPRLDLDNCKKFIDLAYEKMFFDDNKKQIFFNISGGEPTINPIFSSFVKYIKDKNSLIKINSNGGRTLRWWHENGHHFDYSTFTFHTEFTDLEHLKQVILHQLSVNSSTALTIVANPHKFDKVKEAYEYFSQIDNCKVFVKRIIKKWVSDPGFNPDNNEEQNLWINSNMTSGKRLKPETPVIFYSRDNKKLIINPKILGNYKKNNFQGWSCFQGHKNLFIDPFGKVFGSACKVKQLGQINEADQIEWGLHEIICPLNSCNCAEDALIHKKKN